MWGGVREVKEEGDICIHVADSLQCTAQTQHCRAPRPPPKKKKKNQSKERLWMFSLLIEPS